MSRRITKDGRTILTGKDYTVFRRFLYLLQSALCALCKRPCDLYAELEADWSFHVDHIEGRAAGKRDDIESKCRGLCGKCHRIKHGQQSAVRSELQWSKKGLDTRSDLV